MPSSAGLTVEFSIRHGDYTRGNKRSEKENANANESTLGESEWVVSEWSVAPWAEKSSLTAFRITSRKFFLLHFFSSTQLQFIQLSSSSSESNPLNVERLIPRGYFTNGKLTLLCSALLSSPACNAHLRAMHTLYMMNFCCRPYHTKPWWFTCPSQTD